MSSFSLSPTSPLKSLPQTIIVLHQEMLMAVDTRHERLLPVRSGQSPKKIFLHFANIGRSYLWHDANIRFLHVR